MKKEELVTMARTIRTHIITMLAKAGSGHAGGALGMADIFATLYFGGIMKYDPQDPDSKTRDYLVLSNGHICPVLYAAMAEAGFFPKEELLTLRSFRSSLQGHPHREWLKGLETSSGPLGEGLSQAVGMAIGLKIQKQNKRHVWCVVSDGELDEGQSWEAVMLAASRGLDNLTVIVDRNKIQLSGDTDTIMPLEPLTDKWKSFNWEVLEINGHDISEIKQALKDSKKNEKSTVIIAHTIPGKGVSFMEGKYEWHGKAPNKEEAEIALEELTSNSK